MGRSKDIWGPYESDPVNPILTATAFDFNERGIDEFLKPHMYNKDSILQKSGHGSLIETQLGEMYMVHHCSRPFTSELRCTLGRESAIQKMEWTADGWLRLAGGGKLAKEYVQASTLPEHKFASENDAIFFTEGDVLQGWYTPRISHESFAILTERKGFLRLRGQETLCSLNKASLLARKLTSVKTQVTTKMEFQPLIYKHYAGLALYYDNMNYIMLRKYWSDSLTGSALAIMRIENGKKTEFTDTRIALQNDKAIWLRLAINQKEVRFYWSHDGKTYGQIGGIYDTSEFSDEYCKYGEFTGSFAGLFCVDSMTHERYADFEFFDVISDNMVNPQ
jgi:xylan 1,4-beta-xylosidase